MKKILTSLVLTLTIMMNAYGVMPVKAPEFINDTVELISVNMPAKIYFYDVNEFQTTDNVIKYRFSEEARYINCSENMTFEVIDNVLHIELKNYPYEVMKEIDPNFIKLYIPSSYENKIVTSRGFEMRTYNKKKNDSGKSTN